MATKLTAISVRNVTPGNARREIADGGCAGLYLVVQPKPSGAKSWALRYRYLGDTRKLTLGPVLVLGKGEPEPKDIEIGRALTLSAARELAQGALRKLKQGRDPAKDKQDDIAATKDAAIVRATDSIEAIAHRFIQQHVEKKNRDSTRQQVERIFNKEILPRWAGKSVHDITKRHVVALLEAINKDRPMLANRVLATTRKWFNFMIAKDIIKTLSPCAGVEAPAKENSRERVLTNEEIAALWMASDQVDGIFGPFTKLLVLTGQRRSEVAGMRMSEIDTDARTWTLPGERTKNGEQHSVPLSSQAWAIIEAARSGTGDHVLSGTGKTAISGFSKAKRVIDRIVNFRTPWTWHDIRRSVVTHLADDLAVPPHIIEAAVNHISGHKAGVAGVYNRATYAVEKRDALQAWADHIDTIVAKAKATPGDKVIRGKFAKRRA